MATLSRHLAQEVTRFLVPFMQTSDQRGLWISQAFYYTVPRIYQQIDQNGTALVFADRCVRFLWNFGCLAGNIHPLSLLLEETKMGCGEDKWAKIDAWILELNDRCAESPIVRATAPSETPVPPVTPVQTVATLAANRTLTVFVSCSRKDEAIAKRLIAALNAAGHACWFDETDIKSDDTWSRAISAGINNSYAFVTLMSAAANASKWVLREYMAADEKPNLPIVVVQLEACEIPIRMKEKQAIRLFPSYEDGLSKLLVALPVPSTVEINRSVSQRELELEYLSGLRLENWLKTIQSVEQYTTLTVTAQVHVATWMMQKYKHLRALFGGEARAEPALEQREFTNILDAIYEIKRAVLLGEPGAGKTTTLWRLAKDLFDNAITDPKAPIPLLVRLGKWTAADQSLTKFIAQELGELGAHLEKLVADKRVALLLDGLNEIPLGQRKAGKDEQVKSFVDRAYTANPDLIGVISCRERDYTLDLGLDKIDIAPLDPLRIREYVTRYLDSTKGKGAGEGMFWRLAGGQELRSVWRKWEKAGATLDLFFNASDIPRENPNVYGATSSLDDSLWHSKIRASGTLFSLAQNPYMLTMMTDIYRDKGTLPDNRGELFTQFVDELIDRESRTNDRMAKREADLMAALAQLAYIMQNRRDAGANNEEGASTAIPIVDVNRSLMDNDLLYLGGSASLITVSDTVRFSHQLLQEYFAALGMLLEIQARRLKASDLWKPDKWWESTGWEEATILLVGMFPEQIDWISEANPEVAAQCIARSGAVVPSATLEKYRSLWISRLTNLESDPDPRARAAVGRALGLADLDNRPGVGLRADGLPDIAWCEVSEGEFIYQDGEKRTLSTFSIAKYPVTYKQFQAFIDATDGYSNPQWWDGLHPDGLQQQQGGPGNQAFKFWNHPREVVSWYDVMAFCRWLSAKLGYMVRLPTEEQWEKAARGTDGWEYPWGNEYISGYANIHETTGNDSSYILEQTTAVGIYPQGQSPYGALDMSGNVFEWTLTEYNNRSSTDLTNSKSRVLRGGSWSSDQVDARVAYNLGLSPYDRFDGFSFRLVVDPPRPF